MAGDVVQFSDRSTDQGSPFSAGGIKTWSWDFGDDSGSMSQNPKHTYGWGGTYEVTLTVTDASGGTSKITREITVAATVSGRWTGTVTSLSYNTFALTFDLTELPGGSVTGTITIAPYLPQPITSGTFNGNTWQIELACAGYGMVFRGELSASQDRMTGYYYNINTNERGEDWQVNY